MKQFGLTGGIGSGKSTVAAGLVERGAELVDADAIVRELQQPGQPVYAAMVERWGAAIVAEDGSLNRPAVADIVFNDGDELEALNQIVHPAVHEAMTNRRTALESTDAIVVNDIPLLVRADGSADRPEYAALLGIIVVDVPAELAVARLVEHRGFDPADAEARIANQASREDRLAVADFTIDNAGSLDDLEPQLDRCWAWLVETADATESAASAD